jgi:hypothetical protein
MRLSLPKAYAKAPSPEYLNDITFINNCLLCGLFSWALRLAAAEIKLKRYQAANFRPS